MELKNVTKHYISPEGGDPLFVLKQINLKIEKGESLAITGPSGSGKSTLLNIMGALDSPTSGEVLFEGRDLSRLGEKELAVIRNQWIGFIFQSHHLLPQCTILENILVPTLADKRHFSDEIEERARRLLKRVGLESRMHHRPGQLSGGERQRTAVVRALINRPKLLLADEPTGALDRTTARQLGELLINLNHEEGTSIVIVTHWEDLAKQMTRILELRDGILVPARI